MIAAVRPRESLSVVLVQAACELGLVFTFWATFPHEAAARPWLIAAGVGLLLGLAFWHPYRALGFVSTGLTVAFISVLAACIWGWCGVSAAFVGAGLGLATGGLWNARLRGRYSRVPVAWPVLSLALVSLFGLWPLLSQADRTQLSQWYTLAATVALGPATLLAWLSLFRPVFSIFSEAGVWVMYHIRGTGPGLPTVPRSGACLIIANHACWFDPFFLEKVLPRRTTPMMTAKFYDLPIIGWLVRTFGVIRVPEKVMKQSTPEIDLAIDALDRGECVVIFPEGYLRRAEDRPLRRFGRGVWQILKARPGIPVYTCWVEGSWGSYTSYGNGKPMKNKKPDLRRRINIAVSGPLPIPAEVLAEHLKTRIYLMNEVAAARTLLGLPAIPLYELPEKDDEGEPQP